MSETSTVDITSVDNSNFESTYKINNPRSGLTMTAIRAVFAPMIQNGYLLSRYGNALASIARATYSTVTKQSVD